MERLRRTKKGRALLASLRALLTSVLVLISIALSGPLTYDEQAHLRLDVATRSWAWTGDQVVGFDLTAPRQNIFSLARDIDRMIVIVDHGTVLQSRMLGISTWVSRGAIHTVRDALSWFHVSLTATQARLLNLCDPLDSVREGQPILINPDPWQYGIASWYGPGFHGRVAASGEIYNMYDRTAAHKTLPLQSLVRVVATRTGNSVVVRINDRGPYVAGRNIDLSHRAKQLLGMQDLAAVYLERLDPGALDVSCE
jgi:hypothetical protein